MPKERPFRTWMVQNVMPRRASLGKLHADGRHDVPGEALHVPECHLVGHGADLEDALDDAAAGALDALPQLLPDGLGAAHDGVAALLGLLPRRDERDELA